MRSYKDIYNEFHKKFPNIEVDGYADRILSSHLSIDLPNAVFIWLSDGSKIIYISSKEVEEWP